MLAILVVSYTQVIAAHPEGGGAYAVAKANLGRWPSLLAAASLVVDYVLTVAVSLAAGAASLGQRVPVALAPPAAVCLAGLAAPHRGQHVRDHRVGQAADAAGRDVLASASSRRSSSGCSTPTRSRRSARAETFHATEALGIVLILKAFAAGCSAVTGVEAIANGVPAFREPRGARRRSAPRSRWACCWA